MRKEAASSPGRRTAATASDNAPLVPMPPSVFDRFSEMIQQECGIRMPPSKKTMLEARLRKRLRALARAPVSGPAASP